MRHLSNKLAPAMMVLALLLGICSTFDGTVQAQRRNSRADRQIRQVIRRLEQNTNRFRNSLDASLDRSRQDGTRAEDNINAFVRDFENATDQLRQRVDRRQAVAGDVENVLQRAAVIDNFMGRRRAVAGAQDEWNLVKADLNTLASVYQVSSRWDNRSDYPIGGDVANDGRRNGRNWDRYENYGGSFDLRQTALNAGYNEGIKVGQNDRNRNRTGDYRNSSAYQRATTDYSSRLGDRELYRRYYRAGFENGYNDGYGVQVNINQGSNWPNTNYPNTNPNPNYPNANTGSRGRNWDRYGSYGGSFQLRQTALNAGYNEGIKIGREDRSRNSGSDFRSSSAYQDGTKDYSSRLGDRELYRRYYREGFENGYNDGYNGY